LGLNARVVGFPKGGLLRGNVDRETNATAIAEHLKAEVISFASS
jgi:hypothetical protein